MRTPPQQVTVQPQLLRWARDRAALTPGELARRLALREDRITGWEATGQIALHHLEKVAAKTHTPFGYFFLPVPPVESLPISDYRTLDGEPVRHPSVDLLDTIYDCQRRQSWFRDYLVEDAAPPLPFIGSCVYTDPHLVVVNRIRGVLGFSTSGLVDCGSPDRALVWMTERAEAVGILVMRNGVVGSDTHRKLDVNEFRGFALSDEYAPLLFINAADARTAQVFTFVHELAHLWLGVSGVSDSNLQSNQTVERYCNAVAAELLVPLSEIRDQWNTHANPRDESERLAHQFRVSPFVVLIRARDAGVLSAADFAAQYSAPRSFPIAPARKPGGNFSTTQVSRLGKRFSKVVVASTLEGKTSYTEAFRLLGVTHSEKFDKLAQHLGFTR